MEKTLKSSSPLWSLCRNGGDPMFVILKEVKNLIESIDLKTGILCPAFSGTQNDIAK